MLFFKTFSPQEPRDPLLPEARGQAANAGVQVSEKYFFLFLNNNICHFKKHRSAKNTQMEAVYDVSTIKRKTQLFRDFLLKK